VTVVVYVEELTAAIVVVSVEADAETSGIEGGLSTKLLGD
jgi:hypothetical protein